MKAHELARHLLRRPDVEVLINDEPTDNLEIEEICLDSESKEWAVVIWNQSKEPA
jgi:hypothetical protein